MKIASGNRTMIDDGDVLSPGRASKSSKHTAKTAAESLSSTTTTASQRFNSRRQQQTDLDISHDNLTLRERHQQTEEHEDNDIHLNMIQQS
jgi:PAB1-binding protein PBP1